MCNPRSLSRQLTEFLALPAFLASLAVAVCSHVMKRQSLVLLAGKQHMKTLQTAISLALLLTLSSTVGVNTSFAQESDTTPSYINSRTGEPAQLISAYWDGNADLVGRDIVCQQFSTSGETGFITEFRWYRFLPIPAGSVSGFLLTGGLEATPILKSL